MPCLLGVVLNGALTMQPPRGTPRPLEANRSSPQEGFLRRSVRASQRGAVLSSGAEERSSTVVQESFLKGTARCKEAGLPKPGDDLLLHWVRGDWLEGKGEGDTRARGALEVCSLWS